MVKIIGIVGIVAALLLILLIKITAPSTVGPLGVLAVFLCIYVISVSFLTLAMWQGGHVIKKLSKPFTVRRPFRPLGLRQAYYFSSVIGLAPVMLIGMQSVGKVGIYEFLLVVLFTLTGCMYVAKRST